MRRIVLPLLSAALFVSAAASETAIRSVAADHHSLNVAAGETLLLTIDFAKRGVASVIVVDRDGYPVRTLAKEQTVNGHLSLGWDGRDDGGEVVADEAYSFKIDWRGSGTGDTYFPANTPAAIAAVTARSYDRRTGTLVYTLSRPSRVHIQAGTQTADPKTKALVGAVMKTVVNREPRTGGTIAEHWSGYDESGAIFLPDLPEFVVAIAASPLPENAVITFGNGHRRFADTLGSRRGVSLFTSHGHQEHHTGLATQDDLSPALVIEPLNATWSATGRAWTREGEQPLRLRLSVEGPTSAAFRTHPSTVEIFVDGRRIGEPAPKQGDIVEVPLDGASGTHRVTVNWNSEWGPVAANTIQVRRSLREPNAGATQ